MTCWRQDNRRNGVVAHGKLHLVPVANPTLTMLLGKPVQQKRLFRPPYLYVKTLFFFEHGDNISKHTYKRMTYRNHPYLWGIIQSFNACTQNAVINQKIDLSNFLDICHFFVLGVFSSYYFEVFSSFLSAIVTLVSHREH